MTLIRAIDLLAAKIRYSYLFAVWLLLAFVMLQWDFQVAGVSLHLGFAGEINSSLFIYLQVTWVAAVDLIFVKGGLRPISQREGRWRPGVVLAKWVLLAFLLLRPLPIGDGLYLVGLIAILSFTASWPMLVLIGWLFRRRDLPAQ